MVYRIAFALALFSVVKAQSTVCRTDTDCGTGECCYIQPEFMVVSKRQASLLPQPVNTKHDTGVCEKYHGLHDNCFPLETANGHCGCPSNMACTFVPAPTMTLPTLPDLVVSKRKRSIFMPGPGSMQCEMK